ncbi:MAG: type II toxin-antitoxin system PemK/MazF family toxin [Gammaproteobacteria bacterium]|nr:type II toxin-antitoxin system PemK/MazF family toxin [Gammaproteobacteria bacterium]
MATYSAFDVVIVPFPFTDRTATKRRPALVLSDAAAFNDRAAHSVLAMITSAAHSAWPLDTAIADLNAAGLPSSSVVRMKVFTLDHRLILRKSGSLATIDRKAVSRALNALLKRKAA